MARSYYINGQCLVSYNGSELGLTDNVGRVTITPSPHHLPIEVDGWFTVSPERQCTLLDCTISMTLVHFDIAIFETAMVNSTQGSAEGTMPRGGVLLGGSGGYKTLLLSSPGPANNTWTFPSAYIKDNYSLPIGAERSLLQLVWHAIPYTADPYNGGNWSQGVQVYT
jgi:hypothetical protein